jgi:S-adenosylmethionine hydrolase
LAIIQLISDFQSGSYKIGLLHSQLLQGIKDIKVVDISHQIKLQNIVEAAFVVSQLEFDGNEKIITLVRIGSLSQNIIYKHRDKWFVFPNNGLISLVFEIGKNEMLYSCENNEIITVLNQLIQNDTSQLKRAENVVMLTQKKAMEHDHMIVCERIFTDPHGNCYFNLDKTQFDQKFEAGKFSAKIQYVRDVHFYEIHKDYNSVGQGLALLMFSKTGYLKLAINQGNAAQLFRIKENTVISITKI